MERMSNRWAGVAMAILLAASLAVSLAACSDHDSSDSGSGSNGSAPKPSGLSATIRTTTNGVPHIRADNLKSAGFGEGYVQARDNVCLIADSILRATGRRAEFYGPGPKDINIITDFSYRALGLVDDDAYDRLSDDSKALIEGFVAGYNKYVKATPADDLPAQCAGGDWVRPITSQQLYAYYQLITLFASGDQFTTGATFAAAPPGVDPAPHPAAPQQARLDLSAARHVAHLGRHGRPADIGNDGDYTVHDVASNAWGLGKKYTENGKGALLANPHFPYTGNRRLYQSQINVPGRYNVNGATLIGFVVPLIGFNSHLAWSHTVSKARHFTAYKLTLADGNNKAYVKDGKTRPITSRDFTIKVANGTPHPTQLTKTFYYSEYGPMIAANLVNAKLPAWGDSLGGHKIAFTYRDANADTARQVVDQWLAMGSAKTLAQFKKPFQSCGSVLWTNTIYADDQGNAFYIDASATPRLSDAALKALAQRRQANPLVAALDAAGVTLLDGSTSRDDWVEGDCDGRIPYAGEPRLERADFVQNSNDSYWATNPDEPLSGYSPLFGATASQLTPRTRMSLRLLENPSDAGLSNVKPAGDDGQFTAHEIIDALYSNRAYYAETLLKTLRDRCAAIGRAPVHLPATDDDNSSQRSVARGCAALADWNGVFDRDSTGAQVFRVFIAQYDPDYPDQFSVAFDPDHPATTPSTPKPAPADPGDDPMLIALARGLDALDKAEIAYDAPLGTIQYEQQSAGAPPGGTASKAGPRIPWPGTQNVEGGFNIVEPAPGSVEDGTRYPRVAPADTLDKTGQLSAASGQGWVIARGTSWHFGLNFTDHGPVAYGLVSYGQSDNADSPYFSDQDQRFADKNPRRLRYSESDIADDDQLTKQTITTTAGK